jgi:hypothetical protein
MWIMWRWNKLILTTAAIYYVLKQRGWIKPTPLSYKLERNCGSQRWFPSNPLERVKWWRQISHSSPLSTAINITYITHLISSNMIIYINLHHVEDLNFDLSSWNSQMSKNKSEMDQLLTSCTLKLSTFTDEMKPYTGSSKFCMTMTLRCV